MQMNQYKGQAWSHRLRSHFSFTQATEGLGLLPVSHIEMTVGGKKGDSRHLGKKKNKGNVKKNKPKKHGETPGFQLVGGEMGCGIYWNVQC